MKTTTILTALIFFTSCESTYISTLRDFQGTWKIQSIRYLDGNLQINRTGDLGSLNFGEDKVNTSDGLNKGTQTIGTWNVPFQYSFVFSNQQVDISLFGIDKKTIPINAIGRVQVYNYETIDDNTLRIYTDKEFDFSTNKLFTDVSYILKR